MNRLEKNKRLKKTSHSFSKVCIMYYVCFILKYIWEATLWILMDFFEKKKKHGDKKTMSSCHNSLNVYHLKIFLKLTFCKNRQLFLLSDVGNRIKYVSKNYIYEVSSKCCNSKKLEKFLMKRICFASSDKYIY